MTRRATSCGLTVEVHSSSSAWRGVADRAFGDGPVLTPLGQQPAVAGASSAASPADVVVSVEPTHAPFILVDPAPVTRGATGDGRRMVLEDACGSGLDLLVEPSPATVTVRARPRPLARHQALRFVAPGRTELLWRAALLQYPTLWWSGVRGQVPLHVSAALVRGQGVVLAGPGGVGKSTLLSSLGSDEGTPVSDNLCTYDGVRIHGLPEPRRVQGEARAYRRRGMPHGRVERPWDRRQSSVVPTLVMVLRRGTAQDATVRPIPPAVAARALVTGTYAAGELRRYWAFAATLALGTGLGPAHPPILSEADRLAGSVPCVEVVLPARPVTSLGDLVDLAGRAAQTFAGPVETTGPPPAPTAIHSTRGTSGPPLTRARA